ncbi:MAG: hypothetical protein JOZ54_12060 [Acidobacteria bacterium]|nr:hypothetical protein [Acidobacteriota bacterium]
MPSKRTEVTIHSEKGVAPTAASCGLIMPISAIDGATEEHWAEVKNIITEAVESIEDVKFTVRLVSDADEIGVIQKRILQNIYSSDIVICDVSGKNPNVMFELGLRLAFDKATVIVKDDKTDYSFDTGVIEHVGYPRDLRFGKVVDFKRILADKVLQTYRVMQANPDHSIFLKNFGKFQVASLSEQEVPAQTIVLEMLGDIQSELATLKLRTDLPSSRKRETSTAATAKISAAVVAYARRRKMRNFMGLVGNVDFYRAIERDVNAPMLFDGPTQFEAAVDAVLKALANLESA